MFDSIYFDCTKCGASIEAQSKSGKCALDKYDHTAVPSDVARDCNRHAPFICECGAAFKFKDISKQEVSLQVIEL